MNSQLCTVLLIIGYVAGQEPTTHPPPTKDDCICKRNETECACTFVIEHRLTMILDKEKVLVYSDNGILKMRPNGTVLTQDQIDRVITADGERSRLVIAINGTFPGPRIEVYENQLLQLTFVNEFHTDSATVHFHGLHQKETPWMDGVAFVTQCPILPGQSFVYSFKAFPPGTAFYHAHIGDQRSMGLYGPLIVRPKKDPVIEQDNEIIVTFQDWNHLMDAETSYQRMITEQFDFETNLRIPTTYSVDLGQFSRFEFQSGLVNGKGRFWKTTDTHNGAPLERFKIQSGLLYRFRIIGAMTLYPMRVFIPGERLILRGSDAFNLQQIQVQSIILHPGERYDFYWQAPGEPKAKQILLVAETIETPESLKSNKYHAAEAVLEFVDYTTENADPNPGKARQENCTQSPCRTFNCPYQLYPASDNRVCLSFNDVKNNDPIRNPSSILKNGVNSEYFFNFAFPGPPGNTPGSVNGREFVPPTVALLTQPTELTEPCDETQCATNGTCKCTYIQEIESNKVIQMVFLNLGTGSGWSHPIHLHGHSFYVMKVGLGTYSTSTGELIRNNDDINCTDTFGYCSTAAWANSSWEGGNIPGMSDDPPEKDTVVVPTGGYVVVRFVSDNPGMWFLHCHIDLHNTNGMGMVINEGSADSKPKTPPDFPTCRSFFGGGTTYSVNSAIRNSVSFTGSVFALFIGLEILLIAA